MNTLHVICRIGASEYAVPAEEIFQMDAYDGATEVPGSSSYVAGVVQIRQRIIPVLDGRARFGLSPVEPTPETRVVVLSRKDRLVGLVVDSAREVQNIAEEQFHAPPEIVVRQSAGLVRAIAQLKGRIIMLLDTDKVINEESTHG